MPDAEQIVIPFAAHFSIEGEARSDSYRPICDAMWTLGSVLGFPSREEYRLAWSGGRRLDTAHRQIERVRESKASMPPPGSIAIREAQHEIVGEAESAVIMLDKVLDVVVDTLPGRFRIEGPTPPLVLAKREFLGRLRDHYGHIDERALGQIDGKPTPQAEEAWEFEALFMERKFTDGRDSLVRIDEEATALCLAARGYLLKAWDEFVQRARIARAQEAAHGDG
jgi:hypothetical protein